jgi:hypothetical protein
MRKCPKCSGAHLWIEVADAIPFIRCACGLALPVFEALDGGMTLRRNVTPTILLPAPGTKLSRCLRALKDMEIATSREIADRLRQTVVYTSTQLCTLELRGLVVRLDHAKGKRGGSTWVVTDIALEALGD